MTEDLPELTPEQKYHIEKYVKLHLEYEVTKIKFATYLANNSGKLLVGMLILMGVMWSLGFLCGKMTY